MIPLELPYFIYSCLPRIAGRMCSEIHGNILLPPAAPSPERIFIEKFLL
jgi:hypothetical protein